MLFPKTFLRQTKFALSKVRRQGWLPDRRRLIFFGTKSAAKQRRQAEGGKKLRGNHVNMNALGSPAPTMLCSSERKALRDAKE